jgi:hypothetical protein
MRWYLFAVFVCLFVLVSLLTILALFFGIGALNERHEGKLVTAFILEVGSAVVALFYSLFRLKQPTIEVPDISGRWEFVCTTQEDTFPDGGREHGGTADIQLKRTDYLTDVCISGTTEWKRDENGNAIQISFPPQWHTTRGFVTGPDSFEYEYRTTETGGPQLGYSQLSVFSEEGKPVRLEGRFYNLPPGPQIYGAVKYTREGTNKFTSGAKGIRQA